MARTPGQVGCSPPPGFIVTRSHPPRGRVGEKVAPGHTGRALAWESHKHTRRRGVRLSLSPWPGTHAGRDPTLVCVWGTCPRPGPPGCLSGGRQRAAPSPAAPWAAPSHGSPRTIFSFFEIITDSEEAAKQRPVSRGGPAHPGGSRRSSPGPAPSTLRPAPRARVTPRSVFWFSFIFF